MVDGHVDPATVDGIQVFAGDGRATRRRLIDWCDVVIAQLGARGRALRLAARFDRPLVFYMQIGNTPQHILWGKPDLTIFSSHYVRNEFAWIERAIVVHPPIDEADYLTSPGKAVTLVNLSRLKGGHLLPALAERLPGHQFLGVKGWGAQLVPSKPPSNLTILGHQSDMRPVYGNTRVLLVPSIYESYGRVGLEAAASGIPTIAHPNGGVREALDDAAIWADRNDLDAWVDAIKGLDDPLVYESYSERARRRFEQLDPGSELDRLHDAICLLARSRA
jgi:glycosyltransferase involved in cell wall biosynthesis